MTGRSILRSAMQGDLVRAITGLHHPGPGQGQGQGCGDSNITESDHDADGWAQEEGDCNDQDANVHPSATEFCNEVVDNCDGVVDKGKANQRSV